MATGTLCELCGRSTGGDQAYTCTRCAGEAHNALKRIVTDLAADLDDALTRTGGTGPSTGGPRSPGIEMGLTINPAASEARDHLRAVLTGWVKVIHEEIWQAPRTPLPGPVCRRCRHGSCQSIADSHRSALPADTIPACAAWLLPRTGWMRHVPYGPDAMQEIVDAANRAVRAVDLPVRRVPLPTPCPTTVLDDTTGRPRPCGGELHAIVAPGLPTNGEIRCAADRGHTTTGAEWKQRAARRKRIKRHLTAAPARETMTPWRTA